MLYTLCVPHIWGLPWWFTGKESIGICSAGDAGSVLGWDDPMEEGVATHSSVLAERISWTRGSWLLLGYSPYDLKGPDMTKATEHTHMSHILKI